MSLPLGISCLRTATIGNSMKFALGILLAAGSLVAQIVPKVAPPEPPGRVAQTPASEPLPSEKIAQKPILLNDGKPLKIDYRCSDDDIAWGGLSCTADEPCTIFLELSSVEAVGNKIFLAVATGQPVGIR